MKYPSVAMICEFWITSQYGFEHFPITRIFSGDIRSLLFVRYTELLLNLNTPFSPTSFECRYKIFYTEKPYHVFSLHSVAELIFRVLRNTSLM